MYTMHWGKKCTVSIAYGTSTCSHWPHFYVGESRTDYYGIHPTDVLREAWTGSCTIGEEEKTTDCKQASLPRWLPHCSALSQLTRRSLL